MFNICYHGHPPLQLKVEQKPLQKLQNTFWGYCHSFLSLPCPHYDDLRRNYNCDYCKEWKTPADDPVMSAWEHVRVRIKRTQIRRFTCNKSETTQSYMNAVKKVEPQARALYVEDSRSSDEFVRVMVEQGCFILQVTLCSLGGPKPLGYPLDDPVFGKNKCNIGWIRCLVTSMFYISSQIPFLLPKWKRPNDLGRMTFEPSGFFKKRSRWQQQPTTPLHALWLLLTRSVVSSGDEEGEGLLYTSLCPVRGAKELQSAGIIFKKANLYLPCICLDEDTIDLFRNLIDFEAEVGLDMNWSEISAYLRFIKELIRSHEDVKLLVTQGIIDTDPGFEEEIPRYLEELRPLGVGNSHNLGAVPRQIRRYAQPSIRPKILNLNVIGFILTLLQTIYSGLSYHHPLKS
ncbi:hypothetical protein NE237_021751 [Protea cynaroides]|uniref:Uncharacterized protein n=1 Tax=Protea cynaroides TaxID=273540 RepID=A0A9Q0HAT9_9MAGN|nr:hypothetical protein NE237_021751 [Protea cynaroides]